jgi:hypothetical protein
MMDLFEISDNSDNDIENYLEDDDDNSLNINYLNNELSDNETEESINSNIFNNIDFIDINKYKKYDNEIGSNQDTDESDNEVDSLISSIDLGSVNNSDNEESDNEESDSYNLMYSNMIKLELEKKIII